MLNIQDLWTAILASKKMERWHQADLKETKAEQEECSTLSLSIVAEYFTQICHLDFQGFQGA